MVRNFALAQIYKINDILFENVTEFIKSLYFILFVDPFLRDVALSFHFVSANETFQFESTFGYLFFIVVVDIRLYTWFRLAYDI